MNVSFPTNNPLSGVELCAYCKHAVLAHAALALRVVDLRPALHFLWAPGRRNAVTSGERLVLACLPRASLSVASPPLSFPTLCGQAPPLPRHNGGFGHGQ